MISIIISVYRGRAVCINSDCTPAVAEHVGKRERESRLRVVWNNERGNPSESIVRCCLAKNGIIVLLQEYTSGEYSLLATSSTVVWSKREYRDYRRAVIRRCRDRHVCKTAALLHNLTMALTSLIFSVFRLELFVCSPSTCAPRCFSSSFV